jgi:TPR repeat protein
MAWRPLAERGESDAQFYLGGLYFEGAGVSVDAGLAFFWWSLAAESGHLKAGELRDLAERELSGKDRDTILRRAETWRPTRPEPSRAQRAAPTPPLPPSMTVGRVPTGAPPTGAGKDQGAPLVGAEDSASTREAGLAAYRRDDFETAITAWLPLAAYGDRMAQFYVGGLYFDGTGVSASRVQAHLWWSLAAAQGLEMADQLLILLATEMSPAELAQARYLVDSWAATE